MRSVLACFAIAATSCVSSGSFSTLSSGSSSGGDGNVTIPNVFKLKKADAIAALRRAGVQGDIEDEGSLCGSTFEGKIIELGEVCYQHPAAGKVQGAKLVVEIRVQTQDPRHGDIGQITEWRLMPNVIGKTYEQAVADMHQAGFTNDDRIQRSYSDDPSCKPNIVCREYPDFQERAGLNDGKVLYVGSEKIRTSDAVAHDAPPPTTTSTPPPPPTTPPTTPSTTTTTSSTTTTTTPSTPPSPTGERKLWGGNGSPPYRDNDNRVHGPGGPVFMGHGVPCTEKLDHCLRPGVWFAADNVIAGKMFRAVPVFQFENKWWTWRGDVAEQQHLFRTALAEKPEQLQVGKPVVFFVEEGSERFLNNEYDMLVSSRWSVGVIDSVAPGAIHVQGWANIPLETIRLIVEEKQQPQQP